MRKYIILAAVAALSACGGDSEPPIAQCNGTPHAAIVYVGAAPFPELAGIPDACVYGTEAKSVTDLDKIVDRALKESSQIRVYFIGAYTALPLTWRAARPGIADTTSLWFVPDGSSAAGIVGSITTVYVNDTADGARECNVIATQLLAQESPGQCRIWDEGGFTPAQRAAAIAQLQLGR
jgi:hypothetical protein